ncbi:MAG: universal stress protein [Phenylobacterium sp.]|uniref:universal stress protein n=1 Tax=Phenylobacterium sp. TaxID=1871053 RepID=UPI00391C65F4
MTFRDILVQVDETPASVARMRAAAALARRSNAHLTGLFLTSDYLRQYMAAEGLAFLPPDTIAQIVGDHGKAVDEAAEAARMRFEAAAGDAGARSAFVKISGDTPDGLIACARRHDLTITPRHAKACLTDHRISAADLAMASGGPVLILPDEGYAPPIGKRVMVAWNGGREAARALRDAWPLIAEAEELHVLVVSPSGEGGPDGMLQRHLERHGRSANLILDPSHDESAGEVLERQVAEYDIDLVVMGLFGRPRLQELVLGGVSQRMLSRLPTPILVSH